MEVFGYGKLGTCCAAAGAQNADTAYGFAVKIVFHCSHVNAIQGQTQAVVVLSTNCLDTRDLRVSQQCCLRFKPSVT